jgi:NtrC-family two-component system sensor histidine kinase KinB
VPARSLRTRFILAGGLLVTTTIVSGLWSVYTFAHLSDVIDNTLIRGRDVGDLTATISSTLEEEDDALIRFLTTGNADEARSESRRARLELDDISRRLESLLTDKAQRDAARSLRRSVDDYRAAGDVLLQSAGQTDVRKRYHETVYPALRRATADAARLRDLTRDTVNAAGVSTRDEARKSTAIVAGISLVALILSTIVSARLAGSVLRPVHELTDSVEAIREGQLDRRVRVRSPDELGTLADGFNRMAQTVQEYRQSSLGELLLAKATLESTLAALPDAVIVVDPEGHIASTNPRARDVLRAWDREDVKRADQLPVPSSILRAVQDTLRGGQPAGRGDLSQALTVMLGRRTVRLLLTVAPVPNFDGNRCGAVIVLADVTDLARLDELRSELVAVASHELRTPLTTLQMNLLLLEEGAASLDNRQRDLLRAAALGAEELAGTIEELLDMTRIEAGQLRLSRSRFALRDVVEQTVRGLRPRFDDAEIGLGVIDDAAGAVILGDASRLRIVFVNLLSNALKYTPSGGEVTVRLAPGPTEADILTLKVAVTDTGPGIPAEFRERVFEKFFRVEHEQPAAGEGIRGAGIGLFLCRQIVEAHGGRIWCEPGEHGGTTIAFLLPAPQANEHPIEEE